MVWLKRPGCYYDSKSQCAAKDLHTGLFDNMPFHANHNARRSRGDAPALGGASEARLTCAIVSSFENNLPRWAAWCSAFSRPALCCAPCVRFGQRSAAGAAAAAAAGRARVFRPSLNFGLHRIPFPRVAHSRRCRHENRHMDPAGPGSCRGPNTLLAELRIMPWGLGSAIFRRLQGRIMPVNHVHVYMREL